MDYHTCREGLNFQVFVAAAAAVVVHAGTDVLQLDLTSDWALT